MALTRSFKDTVMARIEHDPKYGRALLQEAVQCLLDNEVDVGKTILRDYINATVGFGALSEGTGRQTKSLMRMLSASGNPQASSIFQIIRQVQDLTGVQLKVGASRAPLASRAEH